MGNSKSATGGDFHHFGENIDEKFLSLEISKIEIAVRKIKGMFNHSDIIIYCHQENEILIVSFHQNDHFNERLTYYRQSLIYILNKMSLKQYQEWRIVWERKDEGPYLFITDVILICEEIAKKPYQVADNNCNDSAKQLEICINFLVQFLQSHRNQ